MIDVAQAHIWDISSMRPLDLAVLKLRLLGAEVRVVGVNHASEIIGDRLALHDKRGATDQIALQ